MSKTHYQKPSILAFHAQVSIIYLQALYGMGTNEKQARAKLQLKSSLYLVWYLTLHSQFLTIKTAESPLMLIAFHVYFVVLQDQLNICSINDHAIIFPTLSPI